MAISVPNSSTQLSRSLRLPCGAELSNRLAKAALTEGVADSFNRATPRHLTLYRRWSEGGAGLLITGNVQVDRSHLERAGNLVIDGNGGIAELRALARAGTVGSNHLWMQLNHTGRQTSARFNPQPLAPSAIGLDAALGCGQPLAMSEAQIVDVVARFAAAARVARETGFTGVQIHAAHGYLLSQFLSPLTNQRDDGWGGSLENRARALLETVRAVRRAVGPDFPVSVKLNSADFQKGGFDHFESMQVVRWLEEASVDLLEISGGNYDRIDEMAGRAPREPARDKRESTLRREAYFLDYAAKVRPISRMPLMITGGFRARALMASALAGDELDVIGLGRPMCVMPDLCRRLLDGSLDEAPAPERTMHLDRAALDASIDDRSFHTMETWSQLVWAMNQVLRLADGGDAALEMSLQAANTAYEAHESMAFAAMQR